MSAMNKMDREFVDEHRAMIAAAEAAWRGSYSWHVFDWMAYKLRRKYALIVKRDQIIDLNFRGT